MSKRRDNRRRILKPGESQQANGRYVFKYYVNGEAKFVYSWKLVNTDPLPEGKRECIALRDKEKEIELKINLGISLYDSKITVLELVDRYTAIRTEVKRNTRVGYQTVRNNLCKEGFFCNRRIDSIKTSDAKLFLIRLNKEFKFARNTIRSIKGVLHPAFQMAVQDDLLMKNPFDFPLNDVVENTVDARDALTKEQEKAFLEFLKHDDHYKYYYPGTYILFKTGLRIGEFNGLTVNDINLESMTITVNKQLQYRGKNSYWIERPKTEAGKRIIPISNDPELIECLKFLINKKRPKKEPEVDGVSGFLYISSKNKPLVGYQWSKSLGSASKTYNSIYKNEIPKVTPHVCRHTCTSRLWQKGMNVKSIQVYLGHADISTTLQIYTHVTLDDVRNDLNKVEE
ncbi:MAG: tyrosine-type recombinase/integrase [Bacillota bacterium]|nr:tyrosine-type recombinase/integrase [Bacillota bacterium]